MSARRVALALGVAILAGFGVGFYLVWAALASGGAGGAAPADPEAHTAWYLARASGVVAYLLLFAATALGLALAGRGLEARLGALRLFALHEFLSLVSYVFLALHLAGLFLDRYLQLTPVEILVPFAMPYRPGWTGLGGLALYAGLALTLSFYVRRRIGYRLWRALHYLTFAVFAAALLHGLGSGTDTLTPWMRLVYVGTGFTTTGLLVFRIASRAHGWRRLRSAPNFAPPSNLD